MNVERPGVHVRQNTQKEVVMIFDPITWFLLVLLILLVLILFFWLFSKKPVESWVLYDSIGVPDRTTQVECGDGGDLISINNVRNIDVHVELENRGKCKVTLLIGTNKFLAATAPQAPLGNGVTYVSAYIPFPKGVGISYACASDEEVTECVFRARITVR